LVKKKFFKKFRYTSIPKITKNLTWLKKKKLTKKINEVTF
jgi:hypothetical protein